MSSTGFKLRCSLLGHEKDVRVLCTAFKPNGGFISGSRDNTAKIWAPGETNANFSEGLCLVGHKNFVASICMVPPDDKYPHGLIMTGSLDKMILAYTLDSPDPIYKLEGHNDTVCSLAAGKFGTVLSGSWDTTAKVWLNQKNVMTLSGHEAAVWAVAMMPQAGLMLTGSADKTIKMWKAGKIQKTFPGHTDCVRGLAVLSDNEFLSCSNDATVRRWLVSGECAQIYHGHENYIYSIAPIPGGGFVTSGEDRTMRVWKEGKLVQTVTHPTQSVWTVCVLDNGDIVTGASDAIIRIFTNDPGRMAGEEEQKAYEESLASSTIPSQIGDIKTDELIGPEALLNPGKSDGQTLMVRDGNSITAHQWSASDGRWIKIGDVVGGNSSGKQLHEGKEYDYVFDVDIQEGMPPLKLPYNTSEDPYFAAQKFLERNEISQQFLDQVANFIMEQTKGVQLGTAMPSAADPFTGAGRYVPGGSSNIGSGGTDPFTGAGRYVPGGSDNNHGVSGADPFTGGGRYVPGGATSQPGTSKPMDTSSSNSFYPLNEHLSFKSGNTQGIMKKLIEFNSKAAKNLSLNEDDLNNLQPLLEGKPPSSVQLQSMENLLLWPQDLLFPVLDMLRLSMTNSEVIQHFFNKNGGSSFIDFIAQTMMTNATNQMLSLRIIANAFHHSSGEKALMTHFTQVLMGIESCKDTKNKHGQIALATVLLNFAVSFKHENNSDFLSQCLSTTISAAKSITDPEAVFRLLVCLGTFVHNDPSAKAMALSLDVSDVLQKAKVIKEPVKVMEAANSIQSDLSF